MPDGELFKAVVSYPAIAVVEPALLPPDEWLDYITDRNHEIGYPYFQKADEWLNENGRQHYVNHYDNTDHLNGVGEIVFVFDNRDAALMFKLAMT